MISPPQSGLHPSLLPSPIKTFFLEGKKLWKKKEEGKGHKKDGRPQNRAQTGNLGCNPHLLFPPPTRRTYSTVRTA